jgi:L-2-amino-thiazoline-4-carboxylic acid hydrolase-like protein
MVQASQLAIGRERANEIAREVTELKLERTQTLMEGAAHCDFRFAVPGRQD